VNIYAVLIDAEREENRRLREELAAAKAKHYEECAAMLEPLRKDNNGWNSFSFGVAVNRCIETIRAAIKGRSEMTFTHDTTSAADVAIRDLNTEDLAKVTLALAKDRIAELDSASVEGQSRDAKIVAYMVHTIGTSSPALYPISQKAEAFDAAKRWGAAITALVVHPSAPDVDAALTTDGGGEVSIFNCKTCDETLELRIRNYGGTICDRCRCKQLTEELAAAKAALKRITNWASHGEKAPFNDKAVGYEDARRWVLILVDGEK
jgi:hypothetical protein